MEPHSAGSLRPIARVVAVFFCGVFAFLELYCTQPLLPLLAKVFGASETRVAATVSASTLGVAISALLLARFGERADRKRLIVSAMAVLATIVMLTATAPTLKVLIAWRFLQGLLTPAIFTITIAYITEEWPPILVPRVMSIYVAGTVFGGYVGRVASGMIAHHSNWRVVFFVLGVAGACGALLTQKLLSPSKPKPNSAHTGSPWAPMLRNLRNPRLLATFGIGFCMLFTLVSVFSYITFYLAAPPFFLSTAALSWLFTVYLFGLCATLAVGTVLARVGLRHGMMAAITCCLTGVACTLIHSLVAVGAGLSLASSGVFIAQTCANSFLREAAPSGSRVSAAGMYICSYYIGGTVGGVLPGLIWKAAGWPGCAVLTCSFLVMAGLLAFFGWRSKALMSEPMPV